MARWRRKQTKGYADLPKRLQWREGESLERRVQRYWWLESHGLSVADYLGWLRAERGPHTPAQRRQMSPEQRALWDAERERGDGRDG